MRNFLKYLCAFGIACLVPTLLIVVPYANSELRTSDGYGLVRVKTFFVMALVISGAHVIAFGLPLFLILRIKNLVSIYSSVLLGFFSGATPVGVWAWPLRYAELHGSSSHWADGKMVQTMVNGVPTFEGWQSYIETVFFMGLIGAVGGLAFWLSLRYIGPNKALQRAPAVLDSF